MNKRVLSKIWKILGNIHLGVYPWTFPSFSFSVRANIWWTIIMTDVSIASLILITVIILIIILWRLLCIHQAQFVSLTLKLRWKLMLDFFSILCTFWTRAALYNLVMLIMFDLYAHHWINSGTLSLNCSVSRSERLLLLSNYPLHPNISMYILHTVLYTFPEVLSERICCQVKSFINWWLFP